MYIVYPEKLGTRIVSKRQRETFNATWHGIVLDDTGREGVLALNNLTGEYMSVIGSNNIAQLDTDKVVMALAQALAIPGPATLTRHGRAPLYKGRMAVYPVSLPASMVEECKGFGYGKLAAGVRRCIQFCIDNKFE